MNDAKYSGEVLVIEVFFNSTRPYGVAWRRNGNLLANGPRRNIVTKIASGSPLAVTKSRPLLFVVEGEDVKITTPDVESDFDHSTVTVRTDDKNYRVTYDDAPRDSRIKYVVTKGGKQFVLQLEPPGTQDYSSEFGLLQVFRSRNRPAFGIDKSIVALGKSRTMSLDVVTLFGATSETDATLGGAISYHTLLGSNDIEGYRGIFGFPMRIKFSFGFEGLDLSRVNNSKGLFFGVGFSIPTGPGG